MTESALLIFTRAPIAGHTKTRLIPLLGEAGAAAFHNMILKNTLKKARASNYQTTALWCTSADPDVQQYSQQHQMQLHIQQGADLGARMYHAIHTTLATYKFVTIIGSDCPALNTDILNQSHQYLYNGKDAVLGISKDGGYYLIGVRKADISIFQNIDWGSSSVSDKTQQNLRHINMDYAKLPQLADIDTVEDYRQYIRDL